MSNHLGHTFDYGIVGGGIAGMQLALALISDPFFAEKTILIIDQDSKESNDKTLCYWEQGDGLWDELITHRWNRGKFVNSQGDINELNLDSYTYKLLPSINFYNHTKSVLTAAGQVTWIQSRVSDVQLSQESKAVIKTHTDTYAVHHCFDSRVTQDYEEIIQHSAMVYQPFIGIDVEFQEDVFDPSSFTMMDFQYRKEENTAFFYILPMSTRRAFVEYTLFTPQLPLDMNQYIPHIHSYISDTISKDPYQVHHTEQGMIPMSNFPFHQDNSATLTKIGTAGSWVRPSSGYAFKYIEYYVSKVIANLKAHRVPSYKLFNKRHRMMDTLLLDLLQVENKIGPWIFDTMYRKVETPLILKFLDGNTTLLEDIKIMNSFKWAPFFRAIGRQIV